jgi:plasmid stability protein
LPRGPSANPQHATVHLSLPAELVGRLRERAAAEDRSMTSVTKRALTKHLEGAGDPDAKEDQH